jgi:hypothetical protein
MWKRGATVARVAAVLVKIIVTVIVVFVSYVALKFEWLVLSVPLWRLTLGLLLWSAAVWIFLIIFWLLYGAILVS